MTRRFVFKLEGVLEQRRNAEHERQRDLAGVQRQLQALQLSLEEAAVAAKSASVPLRGRIDPRTLATQVRFSQVMRQKLSALRRQIDAARGDLATAHAALVEASKQRKVLEKLQKRQQARYLAEQQKKEHAAQDEVAQQMSRSDEPPEPNFPFPRS